MAKSLDRVQPSMAYLPPNVQPWLLATLRPILPIWLRSQCGISRIETRYVERLVDITQQFQAGKNRYLMAFRHPTIDDQFALFHLLSYDVPKAAKQMGVRFSKPVHSYFVYDRGIPLWAGEIVTWLYPRVGGIPIYRGKLDRQGLQEIRSLSLTGDFPIAISPEGGTNGHSELLSQLEPGVAQMGFWAAEDLAKAERPEAVKILPVGIQYEYINNPWPRIDEMLMNIERECGLVKPAIQPQERYQRLADLGHHIISFVGDHYRKFYTPVAPELAAIEEEIGPKLQVLLDHILRVSEAHFGIKPKGTTVDRCRRLEQAGWDQVFRSDIKNIEALSVLERGFANQLAKEADSSLWHMRIAESLTAVTGKYISEHPSPTRFAETLLLIWRALNRIKSKPFGKAPYIGDRKAVVTIGEPLSVTERFEYYQSSRSAAKESVNKLTQDLQTAMTDLIVPSAI